MTAPAGSRSYAPERHVDLLELLREELADEPMPGTAGTRPAWDQPDARNIRLVPGRLVDVAVAALLSAVATHLGVLHVAVRDVDGLAAGWYEFRDNSFHPIDDLGEPDGADPLTVYVCGNRGAVLDGGVHTWRRVLLATGAARAVAASAARALGYVLRPVPAASAPGPDSQVFLVQAWGVAPASFERG